MTFSVIDIVLIIPLAYGLIKGAYRGLVREVTSLIGLVGGFIAAYHFSHELFIYFSNYINDPGLGTKVTSALIIFFTVVLVVKLIGNLLTKGLKLIALGALNRLLGAFFGLAKWVFISGLALYFFNGLQENTQLLKPEQLNQSTVYQKLLDIGQQIITLF